MWHKMTSQLYQPAHHQTLSMGTNPLKQLLVIHNVDGTINWDGTITHYCKLWI